MQQILLIGTGRLAFHLGHALLCSGMQMVGVAGRNLQKAGELAKALGCAAFPLGGPLPKAALRILAVSDDAIQAVSAQLPADGTPVIHLSGSKPLELLGAHARRGVVWPIRSFSPGAPADFHKVPLVVDAADAATLGQLLALAEHLSSVVVHLPFSQRQRLHLSAVLASNFPVFLLREAERLLKEHGIAPALVHPLWEAATSIAMNGADQAVTGPARRGDVKTIEQHQRLLEGEPELRRAYTAISELILHTYHPEHRDHKDL